MNQLIYCMRCIDTYTVSEKTEEMMFFFFFFMKGFFWDVGIFR